MKDLWVLRHAKSSWKDPSLDDFSRPLNKRGKRDAPHMAAHCLNRNMRVDAILCSPAKRAVITANCFQETLGIQSDHLHLRESLYHASVSEIMREVYSLPDEYTSILLVGHNPGLTMLINSLTHHGLMNLPTCGLVLVQSQATSWGSFDSEECIFADYQYPKMFFP